MVISCCNVMVALVTLYGVNAGLSLFNVWASTIPETIIIFGMPDKMSGQIDVSLT